MDIIKSEKRLCTCCMETHEVKTIMVKDNITFKGRAVRFDAEYLYCDVADELYVDDSQMQENDKRMKNAYRKSEGLLSSDEIVEVRKKYGVSQVDLCSLLGWGGKTITRYEGHQVQDKAHDAILKKIDSDPDWFIFLLNESKGALSEENFKRYMVYATRLYENNQDNYLRKAIEAKYAKYQGDDLVHGNTVLSLDKVVDVIRYFAASKMIKSLYKVKLMKLMWYSDAFSFKKTGHAITGLVYQSLPMGAVPIGHESIISLKGVPCEEVEMEETTAYHFSLDGDVSFPSLSDGDMDVLDYVIDRLGGMSKKEIVSFMHRERAYIETKPKDIILFNFSDSLQI